MKTIHWIILTALAVLLSSCESDSYCRHREEGRVGFSEAQRKLIPYTKGAIVSFTDKDGELINLKTTDRKNWWITRDLIPEGCSDYFRFEKEEVVLNSMSDDFKIIFWMDLNVYSSANWDLLWDGSCSIHITMNLINYFDFEMYANREGAVSSDELHENLEINNHVYHDVIEIKKTIEDAHNRPMLIQLFYAKDYGIIQIKVDNENVLTLNP